MEIWELYREADPEDRCGLWLRVRSQLPTPSVLSVVRPSQYHPLYGLIEYLLADRSHAPTLETITEAAWQ